MQFVAGLGAAGSLGLMGMTQLLGTESTSVFTATFISMISVAIGVQSGLLIWRPSSQSSLRESSADAPTH